MFVARGIENALADPRHGLVAPDRILVIFEAEGSSVLPMRMAVAGERIAGGS
jgi:hypothetical protein